MKIGDHVTWATPGGVHGSGTITGFIEIKSREDVEAKTYAVVKLDDPSEETHHVPVSYIVA